MKDNITDWALEQYQTIYRDHTITKKDIFYYTYGILHHQGYRAKYKNHLVRGLPNIPLAPDFRSFERAGRALAKLHLNFDMGRRYDLGAPLRPIPDQPKKIKFAKKPNSGPGPAAVPDHSALVIDGMLVYNNLPEPRYRVNGRTPIGWFVDRYSFRPDKSSDITNWPLESKSGDEVRAIIERLVYVGVKSDSIISALPEEFEMDVEASQTVSDDQHQSDLDRYRKAAT